MTRPGDPGRRTELLEGDAASVMVKAVELIGTVPGASSFELAYDARDRRLAEGEEPGPDEPVVWTATAEVRRRYTPGAKPVTRSYSGRHVSDPAAQFPPGGHGQAAALAVVALLEDMGANVVLLDQLRNPQ